MKMITLAAPCRKDSKGLENQRRQGIVKNHFRSASRWGEFPGPPVVKILLFQCRGHGFNPRSGNKDPTCSLGAAPKREMLRCLPPGVSGLDRPFQRDLSGVLWPWSLQVWLTLSERKRRGRRWIGSNAQMRGVAATWGGKPYGEAESSGKLQDPDREAHSVFPAPRVWSPYWTSPSRPAQTPLHGFSMWELLQFAFPFLPFKSPAFKSPRPWVIMKIHISLFWVTLC